MEFMLTGKKLQSMTSPKQMVLILNGQGFPLYCRPLVGKPWQTQQEAAGRVRAGFDAKKVVSVKGCVRDRRNPVAWLIE